MLSVDKETRRRPLAEEKLSNLQQEESTLRNKEELPASRHGKRSEGDGAESVARLVEDLQMDPHEKTSKEPGKVLERGKTEEEFGKAEKRPLPRGESSSKLVDGGEKTASNDEPIQNGTEGEKGEEEADKESSEKDDVKDELEEQENEEEPLEDEEGLVKKPAGGYTSDDLRDGFAYDSEDLQEESEANEEDEYEMLRKEMVGEPSSSALSSESEGEENQQKNSVRDSEEEKEAGGGEIGEGLGEKEDEEEEGKVAVLEEEGLEKDGNELGFEDGDDEDGEEKEEEEEDEEEEDEEEEDDEDEDEEEEDDDEEEEESEEEVDLEEVEEDARGSDLSSSLNGSVSSIPTYYSDKEETPELSSRNATAMSDKNEEGEEMDEDNNENAALSEKSELDQDDGEEAGDNEDEISEIEAGEEQEKDPKPEENDNLLLPSKHRLVSGKSASPEGTVVLSEFDDLESTIFDQREGATPDGRASLNLALTTSNSSEKSEVVIRNWSQFTHITNSSEHQAQRSSDNVVVTHNGKARKKKTLRRRKKSKDGITNTRKESQISPYSSTKKVKNTNRKVDKAKHVLFVPQGYSSTSEYDVNEKPVARKRFKKKAKPQVESASVEKSDEKAGPTRTASDSAFFGSRTNSRGSSDRPAESAHSKRASSPERGFSSEKEEAFSSASPASSGKISRSPAIESVSSAHSSPAPVKPISKISHFNPSRQSQCKSRQSQSFSRQSFIAWKTDGSSRMSSSHSSFIRKVKAANTPTTPAGKRKTLQPIRRGK